MGGRRGCTCGVCTCGSPRRRCKVCCPACAVRTGGVLCARGLCTFACVRVCVQCVESARVWVQLHMPRARARRPGPAALPCRGAPLKRSCALLAAVRVWAIARRARTQEQPPLGARAVQLLHEPHGSLGCELIGGDTVERNTL